MSEELERQKKECEEMSLAAMVWWMMLWYASDEGKIELPSEQEWLSSELVATIIEEVTEEKFRYSWRHSEAGRVKIQQWNAWPEYLNRAVERKPRKLPYSFEPDHPKCRVLDLLRRFVKYHFVHADDKKWYGSALRSFHEENTPVTQGCSRFLPSREMYFRAMEYVSECIADLGFDRMESLTDWLRGIGIQIMRPCIRRDTTYIRAHKS